MEQTWTVTTPADREREAGGNGAWDPLEALREDAAVETAVSDEVPEAPPEADSGAPDEVPETASEADSGAPGPRFEAPSSALSSLAAVEELRFIRLSEQATLPTRGHDSDAGLDLYSAEGARISPGGRVSVGTGLAVAIPDGLAGLVLPRSGLALKHGVTLVNSPGLIDPGYRGEVRVLLHNTDLTSEFKLAAGDRVAQLILVPIAHASPLESDSLDTTVRGSGGFGSTGA